MTKPESIVDAQVEHLLKVVEQYEQEHCEAIKSRAEEQARQVIRDAYAKARERATRSVEEIRSRSLQELKMAEASLQTQIRLARHKLDEAFLEQAWIGLRDALCSRWTDRDGRNQWINEVISRADAALISRCWTIECPDTLDEEECAKLDAQLQSLNLESLEMKKGEDINAGLRICAGGACIDGSVDGLLRQRARLEEMFLASIYSKHLTVTED